ncbi:MAG: helix-turn-helix domain-containing protein [Streptosporangiales bacterium]
MNNADGVTRVLVLDRNLSFRRDIERLLEGNPEFSVLGSGSTLTTLLGELGEGEPELVVLDVQGQDTDVVSRLRSAYPKAKVVVVTMSDATDQVADALAAGVRGWIPKAVTATQLLGALIGVRRGELFIPAQLAALKPPPSLEAEQEAEHEGDPAGSNLGARLRSVRERLGLTRRDVERQSYGRWKAATVASYEAGARTLTVERLAELADFYGASMPELLGASNSTDREALPQLVLQHPVLDLRRLQGLSGEQWSVVLRYLASIQRDRGDYETDVLSLRRRDVPSLAALLGLSPGELTARLTAAGVLRSGTARRSPQPPTEPQA